jgi:hypothetical protein
LEFELLIAHRDGHQALIKSGLAEERLGVFIDQFEDAPSALLDFALKRPHLTKLVRRNALSKDGTSRLYALKKILRPDTRSLRLVSEMEMKLLQAILRSKWRRFAWQTPEAQGSDLSGNLFLC